MSGQGGRTEGIQMSKALQVKVRVTALREALRKALDERAKRYANNDKLEAEHAKAVEAYNAKVLGLVKSGKVKLTDASARGSARGVRHTDVVITVEVPNGILPVEPKSPDVYREWQWRNDRETLEQAIRVLEMTEDEFVNATTLKTVAEYL